MTVEGSQCLEKKGNDSQREVDDYPTRIIIAFEYDSARLGFSEKVKYEIARMLYDEYPPLATINYVWSSNAPVGVVVPNPYTDRSMLVVVESGEKNLNTWINEERNIYADYRKAFKDEPHTISGVAIMTDTDDTGESAITYYGDILFFYKGRHRKREWLRTPIRKPQTKEGGMAKIAFGLDTNDTFPALGIELVSGERIQLPEFTGNGCGVFLVYRGYW